MSSNHQNFHIRMDKSLHSDLKELSEKEHRSLSAQIQLILSQYVEQRKSKA